MPTALPEPRRKLPAIAGDYLRGLSGDGVAGADEVLGQEVGEGVGVGGGGGAGQGVLGASTVEREGAGGGGGWAVGGQGGGDGELLALELGAGAVAAVGGARQAGVVESLVEA